MRSGKLTAIVATVYYAAVFLLVVYHQDMLAMWGMAVGMLLGAARQLLPKSKS